MSNWFSENSKDECNYKIGDRIHGRWEIRDVCGGAGRSGMGIVYVAYDILEDDLFALKTFQPQFIEKKEIREGLKKEATFWMTLKGHPNIVNVSSIEAIGSRLYVIMEYIKPDGAGRNSLGDFICGQKLADKQVLQWTIEICSAMDFAFKKGMACHRDLKPDNIMITSDGRSKVTDFSIAKIKKRSWIPLRDQQYRGNDINRPWPV